MTTRATKPKRRLGSVFQRKQDGRWAAAVTLNGKRITRYVDANLPPNEPGPTHIELAPSDPRVSQVTDTVK